MTGKENMERFEGMEHCAIEFNDGKQSTVQQEILWTRQIRNGSFGLQALTYGGGAMNGPATAYTVPEYEKKDSS